MIKTVDSIGETAGQIWNFLSTNKGRTTLTTVERGVKAPKALVHAAIGWLAREGKVNVAEEKKSTVVELSQQRH